MERMQISLESVVERNGIVVAQARAEAKQARMIWVEVRFKPPSSNQRAELWQEPRDPLSGRKQSFRYYVRTVESNTSK